MELHISISCCPNDNDIANIFSMIADESDSWMILGKSEMTFMQTDGTALEYQEGSLDSHYYCPDANLSPEKMIQALKSYARGDNWWKQAITWEKGVYY